MNTAAMFILPAIIIGVVGWSIIFEWRHRNMLRDYRREVQDWNQLVNDSIDAKIRGDQPQ